MKGRLLPAAVLLAALFAVTAVALEQTALPAVLPVEIFGIVSSFTALGLGWLWLRGHPGRSSMRLAALAGAIVLASGAGWLARQRYMGFEQEQVVFAGQDARLSGTIYWPADRAGAPAAVVVHGSGEGPRSEYAYYARQLAKRGIAAMVYDKRGSGRSTGGLYDDGYAAYASDARAAFDLMSGLTEEVGFIGYSEGEWTVPLAARGRQPAFVAIVGPSGLSPADQVWEEIAMRLARKGFGTREIARARDVHRAVSEYERSALGISELRALLKAASGSDWFAAAEDLPKPEDVGSPDEYEWWRAVMDTAPEALWRNLDVPILLMKGGADEHSSASSTKRRFSKLAPAAEFRTFPGADHNLLQKSAPIPDFAPGYFDQLAKWIESEAGSENR